MVSTAVVVARCHVIEWVRALGAAGDAVRGMSEAAIVIRWLHAPDEGAFANIVTYVGTVSTDEVDRLDAALLTLAAASVDQAARRRLVKFYAVFKIAEMQRYRQFRGFPP
jgi:hypothetical protein